MAVKLYLWGLPKGQYLCCARLPSREVHADLLTSQVSKVKVWKMLPALVMVNRTFSPAWTRIALGMIENSNSVTLISRTTSTLSWAPAPSVLPVVGAGVVVG